MDSEPIFDQIECRKLRENSIKTQSSKEFYIGRSATLPNVNEGDIVIIPTMIRQRITNTGSADLIFLALCTPRYQKSAYEDVDESPET
jgi:oxalate decarboxylase/phosphoglucose isomerase-like protein (cupin superfamily)